MAKSRSPWRALRPILLAGGAALSWLTFSSAAASADTLPDTTSLLGSVTGPVSPATEELAGPAPEVPSPPAAVQPAGLLQPVVGPISGPADNIVASVPVVHHALRADIVSAVSAPIAEVGDGAMAAVVKVIVPSVTGTVPMLEPVVEPVSGLVTGIEPLRVPLPDLPVGAAPGEISPADLLPAPAAAMEAETLSASEVDPAAPEVSGDKTLAASVIGSTNTGVATFAGVSALQGPFSGAPFLTREDPDTADPSPAPAPAPAAPGSGTGSGAWSGAFPSGSAAWLNPFDFSLPSSGTVRVREISEHAPAPVSYDPGSSPD